MEHQSRRRFLKSSTLLAGGAALLPTSLKANEKDEQAIITRTLGKTGIELPVVSMGVMRADSPNLIDAALKLGIKHFDTANGYQGGRNEEMLGNVFKKYPRESFVLATKINPSKFDAYDRNTGTFNEELFSRKFPEELEISLKRLQMDYVDILYIHLVDHPQVALHPIVLEVLKKVKADGKAKHIGISTHKATEILPAAVKSKAYEVVLFMNNFKHADDKKLLKEIEAAGKAGLGLVGMKVMAGGFLDKENTQPVNYSAALKWVLQNEHVHTTIPGITTYDMLLQNFAVAKNISLSNDEKSDLAIAYNSVGMFCTNCQECLAQCPNKLAIPDYMRAYMYAHGYHETRKAKDLVVELGQADSDCMSCPTCVVQCPQGFNIREKYADIVRIKEVSGEFLT